MSIVRVFISSPGDVSDERWRAERVAARLSGALDGVEIEVFHWEAGRCFSAHGGFQDQIPETEAFDITACQVRS
ncbi:MAG: hypothetical protein AAF677_12905 [Pseudomonadota bacterium]